PALPGRIPVSTPALPGRPATPGPARPPAEEPAGSPATPAQSPEASPASSPVIEPGASSRPDAVKLLPSGGSTIHFMVDVPDPELTVAAQSIAAGAMEVHADGYSLSTLRGAARLPERIVVLAVPPAGDVRVRGLAASGTFRDGIVVDQVPALRGPAGTRARAAASTEVARLVDVGWMRNQRIARIAIRPFSYDAAARRLTSYSHVDVMVDVAPVGELDALQSPRDAFEGLYRDVVLNYEQG